MIAKHEIIKSIITKSYSMIFNAFASFSIHAYTKFVHSALLFEQWNPTGLVFINMFSFDWIKNETDFIFIFVHFVPNHWQSDGGRGGVYKTITKIAWKSISIEKVIASATSTHKKNQIKMYITVKMRKCVCAWFTNPIMKSTFELQLLNNRLFLSFFWFDSFYFSFLFVSFLLRCVLCVTGYCDDSGALTWVQWKVNCNCWACIISCYLLRLVISFTFQRLQQPTVSISFSMFREFSSEIDKK